MQAEQQEPSAASPAASYPRPTPKSSVNWLLIGGFAVCTLLGALWMAQWKPWAIDNTVDVSAKHEPSVQIPAQTQLTDSRVESTVTVTQEPMDDEPVLEELPDPGTYDRQLSPAPDRQATPVPQGVEKTTPVSATVLSPVPASAQKHAERKPPAPTAPAIAVQKVRPVPTDAATVNASKPTNPAKPRNTPAPAAAGTLIVAVQPWAEVWIDGRQRGISPPLFKLQLPPGLYTIELRNPDLPGYSQKVQISAGQSVTLRHSFQ
jgi:hypothetical protein